MLMLELCNRGRRTYLEGCEGTCFLGSSISTQITRVWGTHPRWSMAGDAEPSCPCSTL